MHALSVVRRLEVEPDDVHQLLVELRGRPGGEGLSWTTVGPSDEPAAAAAAKLPVSGRGGAVQQEEPAAVGVVGGTAAIGEGVADEATSQGVVVVVLAHVVAQGYAGGFERGARGAGREGQQDAFGDLAQALSLGITMQERDLGRVQSRTQAPTGRRSVS